MCAVEYFTSPQKRGGKLRQEKLKKAALRLSEK